MPKLKERLNIYTTIKPINLFIPTTHRMSITHTIHTVTNSTANRHTPPPSPPHHIQQNCLIQTKRSRDACNAVLPD